MTIVNFSQVTKFYIGKELDEYNPSQQNKLSSCSQMRPLSDQQCVKLFKCNPKEFLCRFVTVDET